MKKNLVSSENDDSKEITNILTRSLCLSMTRYTHKTITATYIPR